MQEPTTGNMVEINEKDVQEAIKLGICVLTVGEVIDIKGLNLRVYSFDKKRVILERFESTDVNKPNRTVVKIGEKITIKNGTFVADSVGEKFLVLRGLPAVSTISQSVIDKFRKSQVEELRK